MTYPWLALVLLAVASVPAVAARRRVAWRAVGLAAVALAVLTIVFDNVMITAELFTFGEGRAAGVWIGRMPVEDLVYPAATVLALPALWHLLERRRRPEEAP